MEKEPFYSRRGSYLRRRLVGWRRPDCACQQPHGPSRGEEHYRPWLIQRITATQPSTGRLVAAVAALTGGLAATLVSLLVIRQWWPGGWGVLLIGAAVAPTAEEIMKIAPAAYVVARRPYWFCRVGQLRGATLGAAVLFAVIENLIYLYLYVQDPGPALIAWRWTVCAALHVGCTLLATRGLIEAWQRAVAEYRRPHITRAVRYVIPAIAIHGAYNAAVIGYEALTGTLLH